MRIAVIGAGSIGTIVGGLISRGGGDIVLVDSFTDNVKVLNKNGAVITGTIEERIPVKAINPEEMSGIYDLVFLTTKQISNKEVLTHLLQFIDENSTVCTLQNGIPEESVASIIGEKRTVGGAVGFGATWIEPGISKLTSSRKVMEQYAFDIGEISGAITPRVLKVQKILERVGRTIVIENMMGVRWSKLLMNATFSGMSAALGCTFGEVLNNDEGIKYVSFIADETIKVAKACGVKMAKMQGKDLAELELKSKSDIVNKLSIYHEIWDEHILLKASMLQDLEKRRKTEIDYINGYVSKKGREAGIKTPYNNMVVAIVKTEEASKSVNAEMAALAQFRVLEEALEVQEL
jgi:2-dehydropantoate 2-reductase